MATFEEVYGCTLDEHIQGMKDRGEWTECHENGHRFESREKAVCLVCGADFEHLIKEAAETIRLAEALTDRDI